MVDVPHDNMLDAAEFTLALHLIQSHLLGRPVPAELPACLTLQPPPSNADVTAAHTGLTQMSRKEYTAYGRLFDTLEVDRVGVLKGENLIKLGDIILRFGYSRSMRGNVRG